MCWISVKERLPMDGQIIAVCVDRTQMGCVCRYCEHEEERLPCLIHSPLRLLGFTWKDVTHWMPLPLDEDSDEEDECGYDKMMSEMREEYMSSLPGVNYGNKMDVAGMQDIGSKATSEKPATDQQGADGSLRGSDL